MITALAQTVGYNALVLSAFVDISTELASQLNECKLVTANERLAREYRRAYDLHNRDAGLAAWPSPSIMSLSRFFLEQYSQLRQLKPGSFGPVLRRNQLLTTAAEIQPEAPAHLVKNFVSALEICRSYDIELEQVRQHHTRGSFFSDWAESLLEKYERPVFQQDIPQILLSAEKTPESGVVVVMLEELTSAERAYFDWLCALTSVQKLDAQGMLTIADSNETVVDLPAAKSISLNRAYAFPNFEDELRACANWAAERLASSPQSRIGVVVPTLSNDHAKVCEEVGLALSPTNGSDDPSFDVSGGEVLSEQAVWQAATQFLQFVFDKRTNDSVHGLIASPFFTQLSLERLQPWPRSLPAQPNLKEISRFVDADWLRSLLAQEVSSAATLQTWVTVFRALLADVGWPNASKLGSRQYQAYLAIEHLLPNLDSNVELDVETALARLDLLLGEETFARETTPSNLLVLGLLEANGLKFDHLWVCGLDDDNFPSRNSATPLIPRRITKQAHVPRADQDDELEFATRLLQRWSNQADELVVSYVREADDAERGLTRLLADISVEQMSVSPAPDWWRERASRLENFSDEYGLPLPSAEATRGGVRLLEDQAACAFRAYAVHRLGIVREEKPSALPDALVRGILLHDALQSLFTFATNRDEAQKLGRVEIETAVNQAIQRLTYKLPAAFESHEKRRIANLLYSWLDIEALRDEFEVYALESTYELTLDQLNLTIRADRIDRLRSGRLIVIDYKTGQVSTSGALEAPITRPQLPVYSLVEESVHGAFYAAIRKDAIRFTGVCDPDGDPGAARMQRLDRTWSEQISLWRTELDRIAHDFVNGYASVDPSPGACDYCHLHTLCRIRERDQ